MRWVWQRLPESIHRPLRRLLGITLPSELFTGKQPCWIDRFLTPNPKR